LRHEAQMQEQDTLISMANRLAGTYDASTCSLNFDYPWRDRTLPTMQLNKRTTILGPDDVALLLRADGTPCQSTRDGTPQTYGPLAPTGVAELEQFVGSKLSGGRVPRISEAVPLDTLMPKGNVTPLAYGIYVTHLGGSGSGGATLIVAGLFDLNRPVQALVPALLIAGPLTLLVAAAGGYWLASRAMRPVRAITRTAQQIGETDLDRRLNLKSSDELGELALTFDRMLDRLQAAFARQRQFTADASHELRTPLTIVDLEVTRALAHRPVPEEYERILSVVQTENAYMVRLVNDLLTLARADAGKATLRGERVDLSDVALAVVERLAPLAHEHAIHLVVGELPELPVSGDPLYLAQAAGNLVENAIKYSAGTGASVRVQTGAVDAKGSEWAWLRVEDDGPGIAPEHLP